MSDIDIAAAGWGFSGAFVYASGRLITVILGEQIANGRQIKQATARFFIAIVFGPIAALGFGGTIIDWTGNKPHPEGIWLVIGLLCNVVWPTIERVSPAMFGQWLGGKLKAMGDALSSK